MRLTAINNAIEALQTQETTVNSVQELAALYIVKDHLEKSENATNSAVENELNDVLPAYKKYCEVKRKFQLGLLSDKVVLDYLKTVCSELRDLIQALYSGTDSKEERKILISGLQNLNFF